MPPFGEQVCFDADTGGTASLNQHERILHGYGVVGHSVPDEHRRGFGVDMLLDGELVEHSLIMGLGSEQILETAAMSELAGGDHRVGKHQCVRTRFVRIEAMFANILIAGRSGEVGGQMTACGKTEYSHLRLVHMPFGGIGADEARSLDVVLQERGR